MRRMGYYQQTLTIEPEHVLVMLTVFERQLRKDTCARRFFFLGGGGALEGDNCIDGQTPGECTSLVLELLPKNPILLYKAPT